MALRWYLGLDLFNAVPDHSTISQLRRRKPKLKNVVEMEALISEVQAALRFFDALADDLIHAQAQFKAFVSRLDEAARFGEKHLRVWAAPGAARL